MAPPSVDFYGLAHAYVIVWPSMWRQQAEGAADRGQSRQAAGAFAEAIRKAPLHPVATGGLE
jgi:hypothetical protein